MIKWLQEWYNDQCDGAWEHSYGIAIGTIDKPGWAVSIDITDTKLDGIDIPSTFYEMATDDWMGYSITNNVFEGVGDPSKLEKIIGVFREIFESRT